MAWKYNDRIIRVGRSWTNDDGITHPRNWAIWSDEDKVAAGLVWEDDPAPFDGRFYWDANTPKSLDDVTTTDEFGKESTQLGLKSSAIAHVKTTAAGLLQPTDWYVTRKAETGTAIPSAVLDYRAAVRTASGAIETAILGATTHAEFMALYNAPEGGTAPINDWPENN